MIIVGSSLPNVFCEKSVLRNFANFTGKHLCQSLFCNKVDKLLNFWWTLSKKRIWHRCLPVNFAKFPRTFFLIEHLRWLLLNSDNMLIFLYLKPTFHVNINLTCSRYTLHILHGHPSGTHLLILKLIALTVSVCFISLGMKSHISGPRLDRSHKKRKDSLETRVAFSWILILTWNFGGGRSGSASTFASASWLWCY